MKCMVLWSFLIASGCAVARGSFYLESKLPLTQNSSISIRITGGDPAASGQFPYQAGIKIKMDSKTAFCGGTLISNQAVLTAAHCCEKADEVEVILGSVSIKDETEPLRVSMVVPRRNIRVHKKWNSLKIVNDICILKLPRQVEFNDNIQPASLPHDDSQNYVKSSVVSSGWGKDNDKATTVSPNLRFVKSKIVSNSICSVFYFGRIKDSHICFDGAGGKSTCNGDSGGPLVLASDGRTLIGITSFGIAFGCEKGWPPVFTRVSKFLPWIKDNVK